MNKVNLTEKFAQFEEQWSPRIVGEVNDMYVKIAKVQGEFIWHQHDDEDEMFMVHKGRLTLRFRDREVVLEPGELCVVPRGVEHQPFAEEECYIVMFEPKGTVNTGNITNEHTKTDLEQI